MVQELLQRNLVKVVPPAENVFTYTISPVVSAAAPVVLGLLLWWAFFWQYLTSILVLPIGEALQQQN
jgi:hypothetical protein